MKRRYARKILDGAYAQIKTYGWIQNKMYRRWWNKPITEVPACALGALLAQVPKRAANRSPHKRKNRHQKALKLARETVENFLPREVHGSLTYWNDQYDTTKEDVLNVLNLARHHV